MGFRTIVIKGRCKLDLKMNYLVCRGEKETRVFIPEISYLILESTAIALTVALLSELNKNNVKIIFCDEKHNPESEIVSYYGHYQSSKKIVEQMHWSKEIKEAIWQKIIQYKIAKQRDFLSALQLSTQANLLNNYCHKVMLGDKTNREGHAAKVYFNALFGMEHNRRENTFENTALNYGYSILLSCFNREVVKNGYITQIGIWHCNAFNFFNLSCDLMEPFRVLIDKIVLSIEDKKLFKSEILKIFSLQLKIDGKLQYFENAIAIYVQSIFRAIEQNNPDLILCYE